MSGSNYISKNRLESIQSNYALESTLNIKVSQDDFQEELENYILIYLIDKVILNCTQLKITKSIFSFDNLLSKELNVSVATIIFQRLR